MTPSALSVLFGRPSVTSSTASPAEPRSSAPGAPAERTAFAGALVDAEHGSARANRSGKSGTSAHRADSGGSSAASGKKGPSAFSSAAREGDTPQDIEGIGTLESNSNDPASKTETGADFAPMPRNTAAAREMSVEPPVATRSADRGSRGRTAPQSGTAPGTPAHAPSDSGLAVSHTGTDSLRVVTTTIDAPLTAVTVQTTTPIDSGQVGAGELPSGDGTNPASGPDIPDAVADQTTDSGNPSPDAGTPATGTENALEAAGVKDSTGTQTAALLTATAATDSPAEGTDPRKAHDRVTRGNGPAPAQGQEGSRPVHARGGQVSPQVTATNPARISDTTTSVSQSAANINAKTPESADTAPRASGTPAAMMGEAGASTADGTPVRSGTPLSPTASTRAASAAGEMPASGTGTPGRSPAAATATATATPTTATATSAQTAAPTGGTEPTPTADGIATAGAPESNSSTDTGVPKASTASTPALDSTPATEAKDGSGRAASNSADSGTRTLSGPTNAAGHRTAPNAALSAVSSEEIPSGDSLSARTTKSDSGTASPAPGAARGGATHDRPQAGPDVTAGRMERTLPQRTPAGESKTPSAPLTQTTEGDADVSRQPSASRAPAAAHSAPEAKPASTAQTVEKAPAAAHARSLAPSALGNVEQTAEAPAAPAHRTVSPPSAGAQTRTPGDASSASSGSQSPLELELPTESGPARQPGAEKAARPASRRGLSFTPAQPETTATPTQRPVFTIRSLYDARGASAGQGLPSPETAAAVVETTPAGVAQEMPERSSEVATALRSADRQESRESPADVAAKAAGTAGAQASASSSHGSSGNGDQRQQQPQPELASAVAPATATGPQEAIFEMPSVDPATLDADMGQLFDNRLLEVLDEWFGETAPTATDRALGGGRSRSGTVASAWLKVVRSSIKTDGPAKDPSSWKEVTIELEDGLGSVNIRARRDSDQLSLQILTTDPNTGTRLSSATDRLQAELRDRYGAEVDLSFASDGGKQQQETATAGSGSSLGGSGASQGIDSAENTDSESRRGADRVWVG